MDRSLNASEGSGDRKMMGELRNDALGIDAVHSLESFTDPEVELGAAIPTSPSYKARRTSSWEKRCESPAPRSPRSSRFRGLLRGKGRECHPQRLFELPQLESRADHGREFEHLGGRGSETRQPVVGDVAHALRAADFVERPRQPRDAVCDLDEPRIAQESPELATEKGNAVGDRVERRRKRRDGADVVRAGELSNQLCHVVVAETGNRQVSHSVDPCEAGEYFGELRSHVLAPIAVCREQK